MDVQIIISLKWVDVITSCFMNSIAYTNVEDDVKLNALVYDTND